MRRQILGIVWQWGVEMPTATALIAGQLLKQPFWYAYPRALFISVFVMACSILLLAVARLRGARRR